VPVACPIRAPEAAPARPRVIGVDVARGSLLFAVSWRRAHAQGPLEQVVATLSGRARRAVLGRATPVTTAGRE
jgi:hypothetical protein